MTQSLSIKHASYNLMLYPLCHKRDELLMHIDCSFLVRSAPHDAPILCIMKRVVRWGFGSYAETLFKTGKESVMSHRAEILQRAHDRAVESGLSYSGAVTPEDAWELLQTLPGARLLDVRSSAELQLVGAVPNALCIEWKTWPGMLPNPHFLAQAEHQLDKEDAVLILCRTGVRSDEAARMLAAHGFSSVYNVLEGFEGERDSLGHRGQLTGWKARDLPWQQG
ncbi:rhodanese-like domain-containing protein [Craterilacuibacter sp.]|uniref:rhodanese-like domain-containing protein n=1 Tax=Craterilacuibacter sp. TaxID=2870909 RepID=UPI003F3ACF78